MSKVRKVVTYAHREWKDMTVLAGENLDIIMGQVVTAFIRRYFGRAAKGARPLGWRGPAPGDPERRRWGRLCQQGKWCAEVYRQPVSARTLSRKPSFTSRTRTPFVDLATKLHQTPGIERCCRKDRATY